MCWERWVCHQLLVNVTVTEGCSGSREQILPRLNSVPPLLCAALLLPAFFLSDLHANAARVGVAAAAGWELPAFQILINLF